MKNLFLKEVMPILAYLGVAMITSCSSKNDESQVDFTLQPDQMTKVAEVSPRYQSYNVEMVEVVGGEFWRPYSQMEKDENGNVIFPELGDGYDVSQKDERMYMKLDPIDLQNPRLLALAKGLAPAYMRVSGTWANAVYFQPEGAAPLTQAPKGFVNVLTADQWRGVVQFSKEADAEIVTSFAVSNGVRDAKGDWTPVEAQKILDYTKSLGGKIAASELFNEPTMPSAGGEMPEGYNASNYARDMAVFYDWAKKEAPEMIVLGPGTVGEGLDGVDFSLLGAGNITAEELMTAEPKAKFDALSYHHYGAASMRMFRNGEPFSIQKENALDPAWIQMTDGALEHYKELRDKHLPEAKIWNTETAEAAAGGDPFAATYRDTFRYLYQLASNARNGLYVHMHNTLVASEYSLIDQVDLTPKPNYWAAYLWNNLMGTDVLDAGETGIEGFYLFAHASKGSEANNKTVLLINTNDTAYTIGVTEGAKLYQLTADNLDAKEVYLNGTTLKVGDDNVLPTLTPTQVEGNTIQIPAYSCTFVVL